MLVPVRAARAMWNTAAMGGVVCGMLITVALVAMHYESAATWGRSSDSIRPKFIPAIVGITCFAPLATWYWGRIRWGLALAVLIPGVALIAFVVIAQLPDAGSRDLNDAELGIAISFILLAPIAIVRRGWPSLITRWRWLRRQLLRIRRAARTGRWWVAVPTWLLGLTLALILLFEAFLVVSFAEFAIRSVGNALAA